MARSPLDLTKHGSIRVTPRGRPMGRPLPLPPAHGETVRVERWGSSKTAANNNLQDDLANGPASASPPCRPPNRGRFCCLPVGSAAVRRGHCDIDQLARSWAPATCCGGGRVAEC